jgi:hypothetical protein
VVLLVVQVSAALEGLSLLEGMSQLEDSLGQCDCDLQHTTRPIFPASLQPPPLIRKYTCALLCHMRLLTYRDHTLYCVLCCAVQLCVVLPVAQVSAAPEGWGLSEDSWDSLVMVGSRPLLQLLLLAYTGSLAAYNICGMVTTGVCCSVPCFTCCRMCSSSHNATIDCQTQVPPLTRPCSNEQRACLHAMCTPAQLCFSRLRAQHTSFCKWC